MMALAIGVLVLGAVYLTLDQVFPNREPGIRKAKGVFAGAAGFLVTMYLLQNPPFLQEVSRQLVLQAVAIVFALLLLLRAVLQKR